MPRPLRIPFAPLLLSLLIALLLSPPAFADTPAQVNAKIVAWATQNLAAYQKAVAYGQHKQSPQIPVPPAVDMPCHVCGDSTQTQGEAQVATWVKQAMEPEATYMTTSLSDGKQVTLFRALGNELSPAAERALNQYGSNDSFIADAAAVSQVLVGQKATEMANRYDKDPHMAYAGILFLLQAARQADLLGGNYGDGAIQLTSTWMSAVAETIDKDVTSGHKYNLCPVYASIFRQIELLGGPQTNMDQFTQTIQKIQDAVKFNVKLQLKADINGADGSYLHATWSGTAKFHLDIDMANTCYTPAFDNNGSMAVTVDSWSSQGIETSSSGVKTPIPITLTSAHSYKVNLAAPQLNLCDPQPIFQIPLSTVKPPQETIMAKGHTENGSFFQSFLAAVVAPNEVNNANTNAVTGQTPTLPGVHPPPANTGAPARPDTSGIQSAADQLKAHQGDIGWLMGPQGQAAIANIQKQALQTTQKVTASAGLVIPNASNFTNFANSMASAHLPWTNGQAQPVNKSLHIKKDNDDIDITVTVTQSAH